MNKNITEIYDDKVGYTTIASVENARKNDRQELSFKRDSGKIVYTNYPEFLSNDESNGKAFADNGYCTNQQIVGPGEVQVFFSHHNQTKENIWYGVQIYNPRRYTYTNKVK